jgi:hypothetical protein
MTLFSILLAASLLTLSFWDLFTNDTEEMNDPMDP